MIVHFIASKGDFKEEYRYLKAIMGTIEDLGHEIARNWIDKEYNYLQKTGDTHQSIDWRLVNSENMEALTRADIVVAEASTKSFSVGYQVATAIHQKKPVLILSRNDAVAGSFTSNISPDFIRNETYTLENVKDKIADFINENDIDNKDLRFNFFIDRQIYNYLRWAAYSTGKNKSEILRELIAREIEKKVD